jgi:signal transduction histidine kinase
MAAANRVQGTSGDAPRRGGARPGASGFGPRVAVAAVLPLAVLVGVMGVEDALELGSAFLVTALTIGFLVVAGLLFVGLRDLRAAQARAGAAMNRALAAEETQRSRAEELARVLRASESLALSGEGQVDYVSVLQSITPEGATSFLVRVEGDAEARVVSAHGPIAAAVVGVRRPFPAAGAGIGGDAAPVVTYSAGDRNAGATVPSEHMAGAEADVEAGLSIRLVDHGGLRLGWLHMVDHQGERILEPGFVSLAQLVANQIGVAMENNALLGRVRLQLAQTQRVHRQLVQASKLGAVGELAAAVAHEVNNPLTGILGYSELLLSELPEDDPRHDEAAVIRDEAFRARSIIKALLEFARPRQTLPVATNLNDLARSTLELVRYRAAQADVKIVVELADLPDLEVDADAFGQVLLNLYTNAIEAMPGGGTLRVATVVEPERAGFVVSDDGVGMDEQTRARIFTPFFSTRVGRTDANGLGLSISLQTVESHGGTIEVTSQPGRGSTFTVWLPTTRMPVEAAGVPAHTAPSAPGPSVGRLYKGSEAT